MPDLDISVLGGGSWGTTMASVIARSAPTTLWARNPETVREVLEQRTNARYLPGARVSSRLKATADLGEAVRTADALLLAVPAQTMRATLEEVRKHIRPWVPVISLAKGLELGTRKRMTEVMVELLPGHPAGALTGPNLAREIIAGQAAATVLAMADETIARTLQKVISTGLFRVYVNTDVVGGELAGALKNVMAIAAGIGDGLGAGDNTRAAVITRGLAELARLGVALGGRPPTFAGLAGMGDLVATCTSQYSRNRHVGEQLARGKAIAEIEREMHMVAEGVKSAPVVLQLAADHGIEMPIAQEVHRVICGGDVRHVLRELLRQKSGAEWEPG